MSTSSDRPETLAESLEQWDPDNTRTTTIDLPYPRGDEPTPFFVFRDPDGRAILVNPMTFDDHLCLDLHGYGKDVRYGKNSVEQPVGVFGMTEGRRYHFGDEVTPLDTSSGWPATAMVAAIVGERGTAGFDEPKGMYWKGRFIVTQDGHVDLPWDRSAMHGPGSHDADHKIASAGQIGELFPPKEMFRIIREKLLAREILTREAADVVLFEGDGVRVRGNSNASGGYFYVIAERLYAPRCFQVLDLSTEHLPSRFATDSLCAEGGVTAAPNREFGWFMHVPAVPVDDLDDPIDPDILAIQLYARQVGCDWVLLDRDGQVNPNLKTFDWSNV